MKHRQPSLTQRILSRFVYPAIIPSILVFVLTPNPVIASIQQQISESFIAINSKSDAAAVMSSNEDGGLLLIKDSKSDQSVFITSRSLALSDSKGTVRLIMLLTKEDEEPYIVFRDKNGQQTKRIQGE